MKSGTTGPLAGSLAVVAGSASAGGTRITSTSWRTWPAPHPLPPLSNPHQGSGGTSSCRRCPTTTAQEPLRPIRPRIQSSPSPSLPRHTQRAAAARRPKATVPCLRLPSRRRPRRRRQGRAIAEPKCHSSRLHRCGRHRCRPPSPKPHPGRCSRQCGHLRKHQAPAPSRAQRSWRPISQRLRCEPPPRGAQQRSHPSSQPTSQRVRGCRGTGQHCMAYKRRQRPAPPLPPSCQPWTVGARRSCSWTGLRLTNHCSPRH